MNRYDDYNYNNRPEYINVEARDITRPAPTKKKKSNRWKLPVIVTAIGLSINLAAAAVGLCYVSSLKSAQSTQSNQASTVSYSVSDDGNDSSSLLLGSSSSSTTSGSTVLTDVTDVVNSAMPSVVSITSRTISYSNAYSGFWGSFGTNSSSSSGEEVDSGVGSGTIVGQNDSELLILTSYHVVEDCSSLYVTFNDGTSVDGTIKGAATDKDIAVVSVPLSDIPSDTLNSISIATLCTDDVAVGEGVIVIGDALGYGQSVVTGIISATSREITVEDSTINVLQTDAAINAGNSGGCMLNENGEIIGISEAKISSSSVEGMCYAIPIKENYELITQLMTGEYNDIEEDEDTSSSDASDYYSYYSNGGSQSGSQSGGFFGMR